MNDYTVRLEDMPCSIKGFIKKEPDDFCTIVINSRLSHDEQVRAFECEAHHLRADMDKREMTADEIEKEAHKNTR